MMKLRRLCTLCALVLIGWSFSPAVNAAMVAQMNLEQMVTQSERIFLGTVIDVSEIRVSAGGGELPAVTYKIRVNDDFKGEFEVVKGVKIAEVTMLGSLKNLADGHHPIAGFPMLRVGEEYLLIVAEPGPSGLTSTMGLGQGCFSFLGKGTDKLAINGANNVGLFRGMPQAMPDGKPVPYTDLSSMINDIAGGAE